MKKRILALLLCFTLLLGLLPAALTAAADGETFKVVDGSGNAASYVEVPQNGKITLGTRKADSVAAGAYQWQISIPNSDNLWANIAGAQGSSLELSYAMVANMLQGGLAYVRCRLTAGGETLYTAAVSVAVSYAAAPQPALMTADVKPVVISEAQPIGDPVITPISTPASTPAPVQAAPAAPANDAPAADSTAEGDSTPAADSTPEGDTTGDTPAANEGAATDTPAPGDTPAANEGAATDTPAPGDTPAANEGGTANETPADNGTTTTETPADNGGTGASNTPTPTTYTIFINYIFADGVQAAPSWSAQVATGNTFTQDIQSPVVVGYTPDQEVVQVNTSEAKTYTVTYQPAEVEFTVKHYQQNVSNDEYTLADTETKKGNTESAVGEGLAKTDYTGFYSLLYDTTTTIAADGSTVVEVYYDRYYYLMNFNLDGGYGVEPIYARYGAPISVDTPTKPGYTFVSWTPSIPATMPDHNTSYTASWKIGESGFTVVFWYENANDGGYSVAGTYTPADVKPGTEKKSGDYKNQNFTGRDTEHFTYNAAKAETVTVKGDGSTVLNVYYTRNTYTLTFRELTCSRWHTHNNSCYKVYKTITAKYQADIHNNFPIKDGNNTIWWDVPDGCESFKADTMLGSIDTMPGENIVFEKSSAQSGAVLYYYIETLNGETGTYTHDGKNFKLYKQITLEKECQLTYSEEFHNITGFTQWWSDPKFDKMEQGGVAYAGYHEGSWFESGYYYINEKNYLCYTRNSYNLKFYNYNSYVDDKGGSVQYEAPLSGYYFEPEYPANLEKNAYVFDGWYTTAGCYEGSEADLNTMTMPASDVILYAKWVPKTHTVKTYLTKVEMDEDKAPTNTWPAVPHGTAVTNPPADPTRDPYKFVGWFYISDTGEEKAFDFSMPVNRDLNLYAKWSSNTLMTYTVRYELEDGTEIAPPTTGSALAGSTKTFNAKTGTELNEGYQSGYFPEVSSHSLTIDIEDTTKNEFIFVYVAKPEVEYTVKYLEKGTGNQLADPKTETTRNAVVTETFKQITGYAPDAYQKQLVLAAEGNEIIFWYTKDDAHAPVQTIHWIQNIEAEGYTEYQSSTNVNAVIGTEYSEEQLTIEGFRYNGEKSNAKGTLTTEGLVLNLYYDRIEYPYEFRFVEKNSDSEKQLADSVTGTARYQKMVAQSAKGIPGYTLVSAENQSINIDIEEGTTAVKNVKTFYYTEQVVNIKYVVVGPTGCGTLDNYQDAQLKVMTGTPNGSTPTANPGFKFVGWYKDEDCTESVEPSWVNGTKLTPSKESIGTADTPAEGYKAATYYAKFEYDLTDLTIVKTGWNSIDENQSFIFKVTGSGIGEIEVVIHGDGSAKITGLQVGKEYTVTEVSGWSWRYEPEKETQKITLGGGVENQVTFTNKRENGKWLSGDNYQENRFTK